jgi:hypothetical protein
MEEVSWNPPLIQVLSQLLHTQTFYPEKLSEATATAVEIQPKQHNSSSILQSLPQKHHQNKCFKNRTGHQTDETS